MKTKLLALWALMYSTIAQAESFLGYGLGIFGSAQYTPAETKVLTLGYRDDFVFGLKKQWEIGAWFDSAGHGRSGSGIFSYQIGLEVTPGVFVLRSMHGLAYITNPDAYLGGSFPQFNHDIYLGVRDDRDRAIGLKYKHISSAGIFSPNMGRDFMMVELGVPW